MNEWKRILSDRRRRIAFICIPILCLFLFFYQKCGGDFGALLTDAQGYRELLQTHQNDTPAQIVKTYEGNWSLTKDEQRLLAQAEHLRDYPGYLKRVQEQAYKMQMSSLFNENRDSYLYRNIIKTAEDFAACTADGVCLGNDRAVQDWLQFALVDWAFLVVIVLLVMAFMEERQKGLAAIIRSCAAGRGKLQLSRLFVLLCYSAGMVLLLYGLPLVLSLCIDGGWSDLLRPVQSLAEFQKCTAQLSILEFLLQFFFVKTACGFLLGLLIWFLLSFLEQVQLCWLMTTAGLVIEYLLYTQIPAQSIFSPLRYVNVFSYVFSSRLYTEYVTINFFNFPVVRRDLLLALLAVTVAILGVLTVWVLTRRYPFGNKDRLGKWLHLWNRVTDVLRRPMGMYGFECYKLLFLSAGGLFILLGLLLTRNIYCNSGAYNRMEDAVYRQYVAAVQGPVTQETFEYLAEAKQQLEDVQMNTSEYETALHRLEQTIAGLEEGAWIVDEAVFLNIFGSNAWRIQRKNGLTALIIIVACLSPLYTLEQSGDVKKVLCSTPGGRNKLFWTKYAVAFSVTVFVWLLVFAREWQAAAKQLGDTILAAPCGSIGILKRYHMTVKEFLALLYACKGLCLLIPMHLCVFIGQRSGGFEKTFLLSGVALLLPAAAYSFGAHALRIATPLSFLSDGNLLLSGATSIIPFISWLMLPLLALWLAKRHWCNCN